MDYLNGFLNWAVALYQQSPRFVVVFIYTVPVLIAIFLSSAAHARLKSEAKLAEQKTTESAPAPAPPSISVTNSGSAEANGPGSTANSGAVSGNATSEQNGKEKSNDKPEGGSK